MFIILVSVWTLTKQCLHCLTFVGQKQSHVECTISLCLYACLMQTLDEVSLPPICVIFSVTWCCFQSCFHCMLSHKFRSWFLLWELEWCAVSQFFTEVISVKFVFVIILLFIFCQLFLNQGGTWFVLKAPVSPNQLECGPMPNVMAALPNIGSALCSTPQSLADAHCWSTVQ